MVPDVCDNKNLSGLAYTSRELGIGAHGRKN